MKSRNQIVAKTEPKNWYIDHVVNRGECWCAIAKPDPECDVGEALWRLRCAILREPKATPARHR